MAHKHFQPRAVEALRAREVDGLVSKLLAEIEIPFPSVGKALIAHLTDLKRILSEDYREASRMLPGDLVRVLADVVERQIRPLAKSLNFWQDARLLKRLQRTLGSSEIEVRARPYRGGAGLALRGFSCHAELDGGRKFVIFLNSAHLPAAVAATFGHELGHYVYASVVDERRDGRTRMEATFADHLYDRREFFADSLVALAAYEYDSIKRLVAASPDDDSADFIATVRGVYEEVRTRFAVDLGAPQLKAVNRMRYLTSMVHFFKVRRALLENHGL